MRETHYFDEISLKTSIRFLFLQERDFLGKL